MPAVATASSLEEKIRSRTAVVGVIGLGYVGLPLVAGFARAGFPVVGFDIDPVKVSSLAANHSYISHFPDSILEELHRDRRFVATSEFSRLGEADAVLVCVPTPLTPHREPDLSYIESTARQIALAARPGQLVVLESTTYPGTTEEILLPALESAGLVIDRDFYLAFSPEREDPNNPDFNLENIPKVVGGVTPRSGELAAMLYGSVVRKVVPVGSARVAEATKLVENIFRSVNIALVNELKICFDRMGIDVWEVLDAASTKPFGFMRFDPGPGWGGHCLAGSEMVRIRSNNLNSILPLHDLFERYRTRLPALPIQDAEVILPDDLEALSIDPKSGSTEWRPVSYLFKRRFAGEFAEISFEGNRKLRTTDRHPMLVVRENRLEVREARELREGDRVPQFCGNDSQAPGAVKDPEVDLLSELPERVVRKLHVRIVGTPWRMHEELLKGLYGWQIRDSIRGDSLAASRFLEIESRISVDRRSTILLCANGSAHSKFPAVLDLTPAFCRFLGYFLSEGCITEEKGNPRVRLTFNRDETEFFEDVVTILSAIGVSVSRYDDKQWHATTLRVGSLVLGHLLRDVLLTGVGSHTMRIPSLVMGASASHHEQLLSGLLRGDGDVEVTTGKRGYTKRGRRYRHEFNTGVVGYFSSSPELLAQAESLLQGLGFVSIRKKGKPYLRLAGQSQLDRLAVLLDGEKRRRLLRLAAARIRPAASRRAMPWAGGNALRVNGVSRLFGSEDVYALEVPGSHTFATTGGVFVHNCIPVDPFYLTWKAREHGVSTRFIELAGEINTRMPEWVVEKLNNALNERGKSLKGSRVLILGVAYKRNIDDVRESPSLEIIELLLGKGSEVLYHDPHVPKLHKMRRHDLSLESVELDEKLLSRCDAVVIVTDHEAVDYALVFSRAALVIDTRNVARRKNLQGPVVRA